MFGDNNQHMKLNNTIEEGNEERTALSILLTISFCHLLDDTMHSMLPAIYPMLKDEFGLSFFQVGIITLVLQLTSSSSNPSSDFMLISIMVGGSYL